MTFQRDDGAECNGVEPVPAEYLVFCVSDVITATVPEGLKAVSVVRWAENIEQRVWKALGKCPFSTQVLLQTDSINLQLQIPNHTENKLVGFIFEHFTDA